MKFGFVLAGVVVLAGNVAFVATSQPAPPSPLAGDWRCNSSTQGVDGVILMSVANDGSARNRTLVNDQIEGRVVIIDIPYTSRFRLQGNELIEDISSFDVSNGSIDGHQLTESMKQVIREQMMAGSVHYVVEEASASRLIYVDQTDRTFCEKTLTPLRL